MKDKANTTEGTDKKLPLDLLVPPVMVLIVTVLRNMVPLLSEIRSYVQL